MSKKWKKKKNYTFYDLIVTKARGKSGPLFHFGKKKIGGTEVEKGGGREGKCFFWVLSFCFFYFWSTRRGEMGHIVWFLRGKKRKKKKDVHDDVRLLANAKVEKDEVKKKKSYEIFRHSTQ